MAEMLRDTPVIPDVCGGNEGDQPMTAPTPPLGIAIPSSREADHIEGAAPAMIAATRTVSTGEAAK